MEERVKVVDCIETEEGKETADEKLLYRGNLHERRGCEAIKALHGRQPVAFRMPL